MSPRLRKLAEALGRLGIAFLILLAIYAVSRFLAPNSGFTQLAALAFYATAMLFVLQLARRNARRVIWRLRNRLIVAYLFIAFVPIALIAILVVLVGWELVGGTAVYLVSSELDRRTSAMDGVAHLLAQTPAEKRENTLRDVLPYLEHLFPNLTLAIRGQQTYSYPAGAESPSAPSGWKDASGLVLKDGQLHAWAHFAQAGTEVTLLAPVTRALLAELSPGIGQVSLISFNSPSSGSPAKSPPAEPKSRRVARLPEPANRLDIAVNGFRPLYFTYWDAPDKQDKWLLVVRTRPSIVLGTVFAQVDLAQGLLAVFVITAGALLLVWVVSFLMGISLTRTITGAVHNLYQGTERVKGGDFSHRIAVEGNDQLAELARSFNGMTENLERLIVVEKEQQRLQSELAIAREVQNQLFPRTIPRVPGMHLVASCRAARVVSGDYYDFISVGSDELALVVADIAGKGISAALLMANLQAALRSQLMDGASVASTAGVVARLNRQLLATAPEDRFATAFLAIYNARTRLLRYTNAGHLPPLYFNGSAVTPLDVGGTIVGMFPDCEYEEGSITIEPGSLLAAYSDGITEPENAYGEQFGKQRLIEVIQRNREQRPEDLLAAVVASVDQWAGTPQQADDMTVVIASAG